jgi:hypothetical protein
VTLYAELSPIQCIDNPTVFSRSDAETYLKEIAKSDIEGKKTVGLSIHCIGLSSAYNVTREHHPGVDFRFVPDYKEVKNLLKNKLNRSKLIVDDEQQQLRFRPRRTNMLPYFGKIGHYIIPTHSFLQRNEYFKGVPVYVVQTMATPRNLLTEQYFNIAGAIDTFYGRFIQSLDSTIGFGHNWIMQGSIQDTMKSEQVNNFVFFSKTQADTFIREHQKNVVRYKGSRTSNIETLVRKPKIYVYNLEDFVEDWEDRLLADESDNKDSGPNFLKAKNINFISPSLSFSGIQDLTTEKNEFQQSSLNKITQTLNIKAKVLKRTFGIFFNTN